MKAQLKTSDQYPPIDHNALIAALDVRDRGLVIPHLRRADVARGDVIFREDEDVSRVAFPIGRTIVTLAVPMREGRLVEAATIGREGAVGGVVSQGYLPAFTRATVQVGGPILRLDTDVLQKAKGSSKSVRDLFIRYADCLLAQVLQSVACNASHGIEQRCIRWLLTLQDRLESETLPVTHEILAEMLGVRRSYLTAVLGTLQKRGLIKIGHGALTLLDRPAAERACCECHSRVRRHFASVIGSLYGPIEQRPTCVIPLPDPPETLMLQDAGP